MKKLLCISALLALATTCIADPFRIVAYGDSITYGWVPNANPPSLSRFALARGPVIIMLGTNDLKPVFNRTPLRIALGGAHLIELVNTLNGGVGTSYKNPKVLLICPPALNPEIDKGPIFGAMFKGGVEKSNRTSQTPIDSGWAPVAPLFS